MLWVRMRCPGFWLGGGLHVHFPTFHFILLINMCVSRYKSSEGRPRHVSLPFGKSKELNTQTMHPFEEL